MASITSQLIVSLLDRVTGPAKRVAQSMRGLNKTIRETGKAASFQDRLDASITRTNQRLADARWRMLDAVAGFYALRAAIAAPINNAAALESKLSGIATKAGLSADEIARLRTQLRASSRDTNQFTGDLATGVDYLVGMGMSGPDAIAAIKAIGIASTATGASVTDMSAAAFASMSSLKIAAEDLPQTFDALTMAGKRGGFEFKDMAQYLPNTAALYSAMGQEGVSAAADIAAAYQVVRKNTGDASSAATNLDNVLGKMMSPATVQKFKKMGVNLRREMKKAEAAGLTPLEAIAEITDKTLKGDISKLGYLFEDTQAQAGVRALIQNLDEFRSIRKDAMGAGGTVQADFDRAMDTTAEKLKAAKIEFDNLSNSIGTALIPVLNRVLEVLLPMIEAFARFTEQNPTLVAGVLSLAGAFTALKIASAGLSFLGLWGKAGALSMMSTALRGIGRIGLAGGLFAAGEGLTAIGAAIGGVGFGLGALAVAGLAISLGLIWHYWDRIASFGSGFLSEIAKEINTQLGPAFEYLEPVLRPIGELFAKIKSAAVDFGSWIGSFFSREILTDAQKAAYEQSGRDVARAMIDSIKATFGELLAWFSTLPAQIVSAIGSIDLGALIKWPTPPAWLSKLLSGGPGDGVTTDPMGTGVDGMRAKGGPISRGASYLVGERGPELITAGRSGYVNKTGTAGAGGGVTVNQTMSFTIAGNADENVIDKIRKVMRDEVRETFRGVFADTGLRIA
jgi:TP901 family phage tail tape measure protein